MAGAAFSEICAGGGAGFWRFLSKSGRSGSESERSKSEPCWHGWELCWHGAELSWHGPELCWHGPELCWHGAELYWHGAELYWHGLEPCWHESARSGPVSYVMATFPARITLSATRRPPARGSAPFWLAPERPQRHRNKRRRIAPCPAPRQAGGLRYVAQASSLPHAVAALRNQPSGAGARLMLICLVSR